MRLSKPQDVHQYYYFVAIIPEISFFSPRVVVLPVTAKKLKPLWNEAKVIHPRFAFVYSTYSHIDLHFLPQLLAMPHSPRALAHPSILFCCSYPHFQTVFAYFRGFRSYLLCITLAFDSILIPFVYFASALSSSHFGRE